MDGHSHEVTTNEDNISNSIENHNKNENLVQIYDLFFDELLNRHVIYVSVMKVGDHQ